ncbi:transcriptional regulator, BadM/Rrf2 family [Pelagirhabdus alkalitolerans]|uniref:Transcriptional regulator, BadM/Rrf2 family n=1 Tax=Pelagirhabdus alkalitolerans TaxID=1612202 RepID=A0A1G6HS56_9BACI|nr:Rrf2 family transcriptional regulator [Pelagirhabdus alkalitolerans]SDB97014.1 transcriptional regulator, BadM/Rrf2 family [Pelagirhabdus alkalitolerans]
MKISTKGRYGLTIMIALSKHNNEGPMSLKKIASDYELSDHYLEQLVPALRNAGLVKSIRGAYGGYLLAKPAEEITAGDIIRILEGPITPVEGIEDEEPVKQALWIRVRDAVKNVLDTTTLKDLSEYNESEDNDPYMFYI